MAVFEIPENLEYIEDIRKFETNDPGHADVFNSVVQDLVNNDAFLKRKAEQHDEKLAWFWNCGNGKADVAKSVDAEGFRLFQGGRIVIRFQLGNTAADFTMNVNGTGNIPVRYRGAPVPADYIHAGHMIEFVYYDNCWNVVGDLTQAQVDALAMEVGNKVDKVSGKGLSTNDYTTAEKNKLSGISANANNYSLPLASSSVRGGAKTGYSQNGKNYPVQLSNEQMYVNVPWIENPYLIQCVKEDGLPYDGLYYLRSIFNIKGDLRFWIQILDKVYGSAYETGVDYATKASKLSVSRNINGVSFDGTSDITHYGICSTSGSTTAKTVSCTGFNLVTGAEITVKFNNTNTASNPTLNVNSTGAKAIYYKGAAVPSGHIAAKGTYTFRYNGTQWELVGDVTQKQVDLLKADSMKLDEDVQSLQKKSDGLNDLFDLMFEGLSDKLRGSDLSPVNGMIWGYAPEGSSKIHYDAGSIDMNETVQCAEITAEPGRIYKVVTYVGEDYINSVIPIQETNISYCLIELPKEWKAGKIVAVFKASETTKRILINRVGSNEDIVVYRLRL